MIGKVAGIIIIISTFFSIVFGNITSLAASILSGAQSAVTLTVTLVGIMSLWCGILRVLTDAGFMSGLAKLMRPFIRLFFPDAAREGSADGDIAANLAANLLGVGNAATPFALSAMKKLQSINPDKDSASGDMITLAVLNTSSLSIIPSTVIAIMRSEGCKNPFAIIVPVWVVSLSCSALSLTLCRIAAYVCKRKSKRKDIVGNSSMVEKRKACE